LPTSGIGNRILTAVNKSPQTGRDPNPTNGKWELTRREAEVLELLRTGAADKEIASALGISRYTAASTSRTF
jgi:DNA-binding CsgD family transcriptional regulator